MKHNVLGVPRLSIFRAAPIAKWQQAAGLPKNAFTSNGITALGLLPFHQKCGRATPRGEAQIERRPVSIRSGPPCRAWVRVRSIRVCWIDLDRAHVWTQSFRACGGGQYAPVLGGLGEARHCRRGAADHEFDLFGGAPARDPPEPSVSVATRTSAAGAVRRTPARSGLCPACAAFSR